MKGAFDGGGRQSAVPTLPGRSGRRGRRPLRGAVRSPVQLSPIGAHLIRPFGPPSPLGEGLTGCVSLPSPSGDTTVRGTVVGFIASATVMLAQLASFRAGGAGRLTQAR